MKGKDKEEECGGRCGSVSEEERGESRGRGRGREHSTCLGWQVAGGWKGIG